MFGRQNCTTMNSALVFLGVCCAFLPTSWVVEGLSDLRLCADPKCHEIISMATGKINYSAGENGMLSFKINSVIHVKSKSAGKDKKLWGIEVNGRQGYAPKELILENKVLIKDSDLKHVVPVIQPVKQEKVAPTTLPTPNAALKPSEDLASTKEEVELTTTTPLIQPTEGGQIVPVTNSDLKVPAQVTPVQPKVEVVDGTAIPMLEEVHTNTRNILSTTAESVAANNSIEKEIVNESNEVTVTDINSVVASSAKEPVEAADTLQTNEQIAADTVPAQATHVQTKVEVVDGTAMPVLEEVRMKTRNILSTSDESDAANNSLEKEIVNESNEEAVADMNSVVASSVTDTTADDDSSPEEEDEDQMEEDENKGNEVENEANNADINKVESKIAMPTAKAPNISNTSPIAETAVESANSNFASVEKVDSLNLDVVQDSRNEPNLNTKSAAVEEEIVATVDPTQIKEEESNTPSDHQTITDLTQEANTYTENKPKNEEVQGNVEPLTQLTTNDTSNENNEVNVAATTEPTVTEPGYLHHVDPREEAFDTTTLPTVLLPAAQSPEMQVSGVPEMPLINDQNVNSSTASGEVLNTVPNETGPVEELQVPDTTVQVKLANEPTPDSSFSTNITTEVPSAPLSAESMPEEKIEEKTTTINVEQNVPTLPIFQTPMQHENLQHQQPPQHASHFQHQYTDPQRQSNTQLDDITDESSTDVNTTEKTELKTEETPVPHMDSNESLQMLSYPDAIDEQSDELLANLASEETQTDLFEALTTPASDEDLPNNNDIGLGSVESITPVTPVADPIPTSTKPNPDDMLEVEIKEKEQGLFATILGTVNSFLSNEKKDVSVEDANMVDDDLQRILFPERAAASVASKTAKESDDEYCEKLSPNDCPSRVTRELHETAGSSSSIAGCQLDLNNMSLDMLLTVAGNKMFEMSELLACLAIVAVTCLFFLFVYYCFCNSSREGELLAKLNTLERSLLATHKENSILKEDLMGTRNKLSSIEDNSFGSNDMVMALKKELEEEVFEKRQLQEQVGNLEKELENAAEAGLELNKIVSELLSNPTGDESIISSVEELQKQLNEQQKTILDINANLAEKSRENSELQLMIAEQNARLSGEIASLQQDNDELEAEKSNLQTRLEEVKREFEEDITKALEGKNYEIKRLQSELVELSKKFEAEHTRYQTSLAKVEALEECLRTVRRDPKVNINHIIDVANVRAELLDIQKRHATLKERLDTETDGKKLAEEQLQLASSENEQLKHDFHQSEKDKLEAQTRLEVLSNYFKEKETQLQKELSLKEAMWLKQQGETTSTVDRLTTMQEEIQALKSQNDALRAEIEAQLAAHKAQTGTLENRAHETWLAARQSERRYEEVRAEATALRRKLTSLAGVGGGGVTGEPNFDKLTAAELNNAPSPIHMESPGSPLLGRLPPPPFLPPPFMGPPPPFMGMPPPFVPPGEMRPPPLGRLMSPPPGAGSGGSGGSAHLPPPRGVRYSSNRGDYDDYDDDEDEDDYVDDDDEEDLEDEKELARLRERRRRRGSDINGSWHRDDSYSPPPRAYRSQSPTDSRYNYPAERDLISTYDTETDFEPSPRKHERRGTRGSRTDSYRDYSPPPSASSPLNASSNSNAGKKQQHSASAFSKGHMSSGSEKSYNAPPQRHGGKKGGKSVV